MQHSEFKLDRRNEKMCLLQIQNTNEGFRRITVQEPKTRFGEIAKKYDSEVVCQYFMFQNCEVYIQ